MTADLPALDAGLRLSGEVYRWASVGYVVQQYRSDDLKCSRHEAILHERLVSIFQSAPACRSTTSPVSRWSEVGS